MEEPLEKTIKFTNPVEDGESAVPDTTDKFPILDKDFPAFCEYMNTKWKISDLFVLAPFYRHMRTKYPDSDFNDWMFDQSFVELLVGNDVLDSRKEDPVHEYHTRRRPRSPKS